MTSFVGKGVYGAAAMGKISVFKRQDIQVKRIKAEDTAAELARLEAAKAEAIAQLSEIYEKALSEVGETNAQIFEIHMMMVEDEDYNETIMGMIEGQGVNAEYAVAVTADNFAEMFSAMDDSYMQARAADVKDISNRIIACLTDCGDAKNVSEEKVIICADDLAPSETVCLDKEKVLAFVTAHGSSNSHTAILARNMNIPAIIGVGEEFLSQIKDGDFAIADGCTGTLIVDPDESTVDTYKKKIQADAEKKALLQKLRGKENITLDGTKIHIYANIGSVDNIGAVLLNDAGGIGLFRSEFLYLENSSYPTEEQQFKVYKKVLESMGAKKVIIRTLDIGADKQADYLNLDVEENPALGLRGLRICLEHPEIFRPQLRAIFRASAYGNLSVMFPMVASTWELRKAKALCAEIRRELTAEGKLVGKVPIGVMVETPAAAVIASDLAKEADFFSVGTNDLTQYTLAVDRQNANLGEFYDPYHPAVLALMAHVAKCAKEAGIWAGICGELGADPKLTETFIKMGFTELSMAPGRILGLRKLVCESEV